MATPALLVAAIVILVTSPFAAAVIVGTSSQSQTLTEGWTRLTPQTNPPWEAGAMTYDAIDGYVLSFGGGSSTGLSNETWELQGGEWTQLHPLVGPAPRLGAGMAYDAADGYVVLFGGLGTSWFNDTWEFRGGQWSELHPGVSPSAREFSSMAYDPALHAVILFGGSGPSSPGNDTWAFSGGEWRELHPSTSPSSVLAPAFAYDGATGDVLLFGGLKLGFPVGVLNGTWTFNGSAWEQLHPNRSPENRTGAGAVYDAADGTVVLFGGTCSTAACSNTTWLFRQDSWSSFTTTSGGPNPTDEPEIAYDPVDEYVVLLENASVSANLSSTWVFVGPTSPGGSSTFLGLPDSYGYVVLGAMVLVIVFATVLTVLRIQKRPGRENAREQLYPRT